MNNPAIRFCFFLFGLVVCATASATETARESATANLSDFRVRVFDLTPDDGQAAGFRIEDATRQLSIAIYTPTFLEWPITAQVTVPTGVAHTLPLSAYSVEVTAFTGTAFGNAGIRYDLVEEPAPNYGFGAGTHQSMSIVLAPHSLLTVDGVVSSTAMNFTTFSGTSCYMAAQLSGLSTSSFNVYARELTGMFYSPYEVAYANAGDEELALRLDLDLYAGVHQIPEPAGYLMFLAGLGALSAKRFAQSLCGGRGRRHRVGKTRFGMALFGAMMSLGATAAAAPDMLAHLSNTAFSVVDLDPADGVAAAFTIDTQSILIRNEINGYRGGPREYLYPHPGEAARSELAYEGFRTSIATDGQVGTAVSEIDWGAPPSHSLDIELLNVYDYTAQIILSARSALILSATLSQQYVYPGYPPGMLDYALAMSSLRATMRGPYNVAQYDSKLYSSDWNESNAFSLVVTNLGMEDIAVDVRLDYSSSLRAWGTIPSIPEPPAGVMLAAGLALLPFVRSRSRHQDRGIDARTGPLEADSLRQSQRSAHRRIALAV